MNEKQVVNQRSSIAGDPVDYILVGQGIAGTVLAYRLLEAGKTIRVYDRAEVMSGSRVAAGIINPVTGRKMVKTWMIDELLPEVQKLYRGMERLLGSQFLEEIAIQKLFSSVKEQNDWMVRRQSPGYEPYLSDVFYPIWEGVLCSHGAGTIQRGLWLDIRRLVDAYGIWLKDQGMLKTEHFDSGELLFGEGGLTYRDTRAKRIVYCAGYHQTDAFFPDLPLRPAKGEILDVRCDLPGLEIGIMNRNGFLLPTGPMQFRVGATIKPWDLTPGPTEEARQELEEKMRSFTTLPFEVTDHQAAFRPTVKDRRPLVGRSRSHPNAYLFNGLGTKGASLAPWCARHLVALMESSTPVPEEIDIHRFQP